MITILVVKEIPRDTLARRIKESLFTISTETGVDNDFFSKWVDHIKRELEERFGIKATRRIIGMLLRDIQEKEFRYKGEKYIFSEYKPMGTFRLYRA